MLNDKCQLIAGIQFDSVAFLHDPLVNKVRRQSAKLKDPMQVRKGFPFTDSIFHYMNNYIKNSGFVVMSSRNVGKSKSHSIWGPDTKYTIHIPHTKEEVSKEDRDAIHCLVQALNRMHVIVDLQISMMADHGTNKTQYVGWRFNIPNRIEF